MSEITDEETRIILGAMACLHQLKYIADIAISMNENKMLLESLIKEIVEIKEKMR